jgi:hypothetical protein
MKDPAVLFFTGDFLNGCTDLTFEERGQYITLLCLQHQKGHLSMKAIKLSVGNVSADVMSKFTKDEIGLFYNERMEKEIIKRKENSERQRERIQKYWDDKRNDGNTVELPIRNRNENRNIIEDINRRENVFKSEVLEFGEKYPLTIIGKFCDYWTEKNKSCTKMKFELQKTFEISKRLATWANNDKEFNKQSFSNPKYSTKYLKDEPVR